MESISRERLRQILLEESVAFPSVKTWKSSKDPQFADKLRRLSELTNRPHNPPIVVSVDEMGPISLQPHGGHTWARSGHPTECRRPTGGSAEFAIGWAPTTTITSDSEGISRSPRTEQGTCDSFGGSEGTTPRADGFI